MYKVIKSITNKYFKSSIQSSLLGSKKIVGQGSRMVINVPVDLEAMLKMSAEKANFIFAPFDISFADHLSFLVVPFVANLRIKKTFFQTKHSLALQQIQLLTQR